LTRPSPNSYTFHGIPPTSQWPFWGHEDSKSIHIGNTLVSAKTESVHTVQERSSFSMITAPVRDEFDEFTRQLDEVLHSEIGVVDSITHYLAANRGKCLRPTLLLLCNKSQGSIDTNTIRAAVGIELLQISTLLHDDVIDDSPIRRGNPSVNIRWGNATAILMGDMLFTHALALFTESDSIPLMHTASRNARVMLEGEMAARDLRANPDFSEETYLDVNRRKTGAMISLACECGARLAQAEDHVIEGLASFGSQLGVAFQIMDDILDVVADSETAGKPTGQDIREGSVTLPLLRALRSASDTEADAIRERVLAGITTDEEWDFIRHFIDSHQGVESARDVARQTIDSAREYLNCLNPSAARQGLQRLLRYVLDRRH
jgi:octaprenyl-diphosphate synthase